MMSKAYLLGALGDATPRRYTYRLSQKYRTYVEMIAQGVRALGGKAWIYREGRERQLYVVEFAKSFLVDAKVQTLQEKADYVQGYFDAEGSVPRNPKARFYIYLAQKNRASLEQVRSYLEELGIRCGRIHNPSKKADPNYWRFYVLSRSHRDFCRLIGSRHPVKSRVLRMKI
jgi:hypothetical protein